MVQVVPGPPTSWSVLGNAEQKLALCVAGVSTSFVLQVQDSHGNRSLQGGAEFAVTVEQAGEDSAEPLHSPSAKGAGT